jgi:hypothetical protein
VRGYVIIVGVNTLKMRIITGAAGHTHLNMVERFGGVVEKQK